MDVYALSDPRSKRAQHDLLEHGAFEQPPGNEPNGVLHHPVAHVKIAPDRFAPRAVTADQDLLDTTASAAVNEV